MKNDAATVNIGNFFLNTINRRMVGVREDFAAAMSVKIGSQQRKHHIVRSLGGMSAFDNYECEGQISMFDSFETMPEEDAVAKIGKACGIEFKRRDDFWGWEYKKKSSVIRVHYGRYAFDDCDKYISCSVDHKMGGTSCPCDSFDEAIRRVKGYLKEINGK